MKYRQFVTYIIVGLGSYVVEMGSLFILKTAFLLSDVAAVAVSFWIGFFVAFVLQKLVTFQNHDKKPKTVTKQLVSYAILAGWNYIFTLGVVALFAPIASVFIVRSGAITVITLWNYFVYRRFIFTGSGKEDQ